MSKTWTTYRMADGSLVYGEYSFVTETDFFDELDEPIEVIKETWVLQGSEVVTFSPSWWDQEEYDEWYDEAIEESKMGSKVPLRSE